VKRAAVGALREVRRWSSLGGEPGSDGDPEGREDRSGEELYWTVDIFSSRLGVAIIVLLPPESTAQSETRRGQQLRSRLRLPWRCWTSPMFVGKVQERSYPRNQNKMQASR
jgi:hypothetical protein